MDSIIHDKIYNRDCCSYYTRFATEASLVDSLIHERSTTMTPPYFTGLPTEASSVDSILHEKTENYDYCTYHTRLTAEALSAHSIRHEKTHN